MVTCVVFGCKNRSDSDAKSKGITFHLFPKDESRKALWENAVRRKNWRASKWSTICSQHFREEDIDRTSLSTVRLRENAVPSVFPTHPEHLQKRKKRRSPPAQRQQASKLEEPELPPTIITPGRKCFMCSKETGSTGSPLTDVTNTTKMQLHQKLSKVIGAELDLIVDEDGVICHGCCHLLNHIDRIEVEHRLLTKSVVDCMRRTFGFGYVQDENHMPGAVLTSIEDNSRKFRIPVQKCSLSLNVPKKDTSRDAVLRRKTVAPSDTDYKTKNRKLLLCRIPEKKTDAEQNKQYYHCKLCNFESTHKSVFLFHLQRHLQRNYRCDFCNTLLPKDLNYWIARMQKQLI